MSRPNIQNILVVRGDDDDKIIDFSANISDFDDVWFTVREGWRDNGDDSGAVFQAKLSLGGLSAGLTNKQLRLALPNAVTTTWWLPRYVYDVQVVASGKVVTTQCGRIHMIKDVTASVT
jgi:hypothetical protein